MSRTKLRGLAAASILSGALAFGAAPQASAAETPYDMNVILPLTGGGAFLGKAEQVALRAARDAINDHGGIHGHPLHLIFHDDQTSPQVDLQLVNGILPSHPAVILGSTISALCNAMAPLVEANGPVMYCFSPSISPKPGGYVFTSSINSHDQQRALLTYFRDKGWKRIALITTTDASGQNAEKNITKLVKEPEFKGMTLVANEHFARSDVTVTAQIATMQAAHPQAIVSWATAAAGATVFRGLKEAGIDLPTAPSGSNMTVQQMLDYASFLPKRIYFGAGEWAADADPRLHMPAAVAAQQKLFFASMKKVGVYPDAANNLGWEPIRVVADALNKLPYGATAKQLRDFLINWQGHVGATGIYNFKRTPQRGLDIHNAVVVRWNAAKKKWHLVSKLGGAPLE